jgi:hypothetical protein
VDAFVDDWKGVEETQQQGTLDGSIVAQAVILYMKDKDRVELSARRLHDAIQKGADDDLDLTSDKTWPKTGRTLWKRIREVTPLLEVHGIRAYRESHNRTGRRIILDTDFEDDPEDDNYAKYRDDKIGVSSQLSSQSHLSSQLSSLSAPDTYADAGDVYKWDDKSGLLSPSHVLIKKEERVQEGLKRAQGERSPDLSSLSSPSSPSSTGDSHGVENGTQKQPVHRDPEAWFPAVAPSPDTPDPEAWEGSF